MSLTVTVVGDGELEDKARALLREATRFQRRVSQATGRAVNRVYRPTLIGLIPTFMPSGYSNDLANDIRVSTAVRFAGASPGVTAVVSAPTGGKFGRAVSRLEIGELRHPDIRDLYPRRKARGEWRWHPQRVRRGFASVPLKATQPQIVREIDDELAEIAREVERS